MKVHKTAKKIVSELPFFKKSHQLTFLPHLFLMEWLKLRRVTVSGNGKEMKEPAVSHTAGGNIQ